MRLFTAEMFSTLYPNQSLLLTQISTNLTAELGPSGVTNLVTVIDNTFSNNLVPFLNQMVAFVQDYKARNITETPTIRDAFAKVNEFLTARRGKTIICRMIAQFKAFGESTWLAYRAQLIQIYPFDQYPCGWINTSSSTTPQTLG